jgi:hypothetical protein
MFFSDFLRLVIQVSSSLVPVVIAFLRLLLPGMVLPVSSYSDLRTSTVIPLKGIILSPVDVLEEVSKFLTCHHRPESTADRRLLTPNMRNIASIILLADGWVCLF